MKKLFIVFLILAMFAILASCEALPEELPEELPSEIPDELPDIGTHTHVMSDWAVVDEPTCLATGLEESVCECGYKETRELPITDHIWVEASCKAPKTCDLCEETDGEPLDHSYTEATCLAPSTCEMCGDTVGIALSHQYNYEAICITCGNYAPVGEYKFQSNGDGTCALVNGGSYNVHAVIPSVSPDGDIVTSIDGAFHGSSCLRTVVIPDTVTKINYQAFANCAGLLEVTIPDSVTEIGYGAFSGCTSLKLDKLPKNLEKIGEGAFSLCSFEDLVIPDSVTVIDKFAFERATIGILTLGRGLETVKDYGFMNATIDMVFVPDLSTWCKIDFTTQRSNPLIPPEFSDHTVKLFVDGELLTDLVIPEDITVIKQYAFDHCTSLKSVVIHDRVTEIGDYAFANCQNVESIKMGDGVTTIGVNSFAYCTSLTDLTLSQSLEAIPSAFAYCRSLEFVDIPDSVKIIDREAFFRCTSLRTLVLGHGLEEIGIAAFGECPLVNIYYVGTGDEFAKVIIPDYYLNFSHDQVQCGHVRWE